MAWAEKHNGKFRWEIFPECKGCYLLRQEYEAELAREAEGKPTMYWNDFRLVEPNFAPTPFKDQSDYQRPRKRKKDVPIWKRNH